MDHINVSPPPEGNKHPDNDEQTLEDLELAEELFVTELLRNMGAVTDPPENDDKYTEDN